MAYWNNDKFTIIGKSHDYLNSRSVMCKQCKPHNRRYFNTSASSLLSPSHHFTIISATCKLTMPSFLFAVFLLSTTAAGCSSSAIGGSVSPELPEVSSHSCPPTSEEDNFLQTLFSIPQLPFINVSAQVKQNGFCPIPIEVEELKRRLRFDPETKLNAVSQKFLFHFKSRILIWFAGDGS